MNNIERMLNECGAFTETKNPILGTSGIPTFYFINTEKLLCDNGKWETFADDSAGMISHSVELYKTTPFNTVILALAEMAKSMLKNQSIDGISGFQRRDWPFSGPLAFHLQLPHVSIYKNQTIEEIHFRSGGVRIVKHQADIRKKKLLHVSDLLTAGSSAANGWAPIFRERSVSCLGLINVVSRRQTGERVLKSHGIESRSLVYADEKFLKKYSAQPEITIPYFNNSEDTIRKYLEEHGAGCFVRFFKPDANPKLPRAIKFYHSYAKKYLGKTQLSELDQLTKEQFGTTASEIAS